MANKEQVQWKREGRLQNIGDREVLSVIRTYNGTYTVTAHEKLETDCKSVDAVVLAIKDWLNRN